jgi:hypothetical protein
MSYKPFDYDFHVAAFSARERPSVAAGGGEFDNSPEFYAYIFGEFRRNQKMPTVVSKFPEIFPRHTNPLIMAGISGVMRKPGNRRERMQIFSVISLFRILLNEAERPDFNYPGLLLMITEFLLADQAGVCEDLMLLEHWILLVVRISKHVRRISPENATYIYDFCDVFVEHGHAQLLCLTLKNLFDNKALNSAIRFRQIFLRIMSEVSRLPVLELGYAYCVAHPFEISSITELVRESGKLELRGASVAETAMFIRYMQLNFEAINRKCVNFVTKWTNLVGAFLQVVSEISDYNIPISSLMDLVVRTAASPDKLTHTAMETLSRLQEHAGDFENYRVMTKSNIYTVYHTMVLYVPNSEFVAFHEAFSLWLPMEVEEYPEDEGLTRSYTEYVRRLDELGLCSDDLLLRKDL